MGVSDRASKISFVIAAVCILVYIAAIAFGAVRIIDNIGEHRNFADREFQDLADRAASSAVLYGFMSEAYRESINDFLGDSKTLLAVIITGSDGEYAFEKYPGNGIDWTGFSPRFKVRAGFAGESFHLPLRIEGQRNGTISAVSSFVDNELFLEVLRNTLLAVLIALTVAFVTLILELTLKKRSVQSRRAASRASAADFDADIPADTEENAEDGTEEDSETLPDETFAAEEQDDMGLPFEESGAEEDLPFEESGFEETEISAGLMEDEDNNDALSGETGFPEEEFSLDANLSLTGEDESEKDEDEHPQGLFSPRGNVGWESYTHDRLASELHRCASFEQDLVFLIMEFGGDETISDVLFRRFTNEAVAFFTMRDLIFEQGENGVSVILPSTDLELGMAKSEEFRSRIIGKLPEFEGRAGLCIGLSSRAGRLIEAERLILEASTALKKALADPVSPVIAFKSDLEKYREFVRKSDRG